MFDTKRRRLLMAKKKITDLPVQEFLSKIDEYLEKGEKPNLSYLLEEILNYIMRKEREEYLKKNSFDFANEFYNRKLNIKFGELDIKVPRVRIGKTFRPSLLPARWKRVDKDYEELLIAMLTNGFTKSRIAKTVRKLGLSFSEDSLEMVEELIYEKLDYFKTRPLHPDWFAVFIDAYNCEIREEGKMVKVSIFVAVGIDLEGYKHILGYWVHKGNENLSLWGEVFQDMISRGLSKVFVFITDNFSGLSKLLKKYFPLLDHQLCFVHFARNLRNQLSPKVSKIAIDIWKKMKMAYDYDEGSKLYDELVTVIEKYKPDYAKYLRNHKENYLNFLKYPEEIRKYVYTTNLVESINAGLERMRYDVGGYFGSMKNVEVNLFVQLINLHDSWLTKPIPVLKAKSYELKQMFLLKFNLSEDNVYAIHNF